MIIRLLPKSTSRDSISPSHRGSLVPGCAVAFASGTWCLQQQPWLFPSNALFVALTLAVLLLVSTRYWRGSVFIAFFLLGFVWAHYRAEVRLQNRLDPALEKTELQLTGVVYGVPLAVLGIAGDGLRFRFLVEQAAQLDGQVVNAQVPRQISLSWYGTPAQAVPPLRAGERWRLVARLKRPHGLANPYGFDGERWLLEENLRANGTVKAGTVKTGAVTTETANEHAGAQRLAEFVPSLPTTIDRTRQQLAEQILRSLAGTRYGGVIAALVMGEQRYIQNDDWTLFNRTGIGHLVSISGLHITMLAGLAAWLAGAWWRTAVRHGQRWAQGLAQAKFAALVGGVVAFSYTLLAGFAVPAQRTFFMLAVVALGLWAGRATRPFHLLALALGVVVALDPWAVTAAGFWLSFGAVAFLMWALPTGGVEADWRARLRTAIHAQCVVTVGLLPLTLIFFQQASVVGPVANALAIPLVSWVVAPLSLLGALLQSLSGWAGLLQAAEILLAGLMQVLIYLAQWPWAALEFAAPPAWLSVVGVLGTVLMLMPQRPLWQRAAGLGLLLPMLCVPSAQPAYGSFTATALDIGQGSAVLLQTQKHVLLFDTGPRWSEESDAGERVVLPHLRALGLKKIDRMVVSHNDSDHSGGALSLLQARQVKEVWGSLPQTHPIRAQALAQAASFTACEAGQQWHWDGVEFSVLHPAPDTQARNDNGLSCVLRVSTGKHSLLLTGDIETPQEAEVLTRYAGADLSSTVLIAPHHGSRSSSSPAFIGALQAQAVVFQAGYLNRFGHPRAEVLKRYQETAASLWRTDQDGAVFIEITPQTWSVTTQRQQQPRYWHHL